MLNATIQELALGLSNKDFSSVELTQFFLSRIDAHDSVINSLISTNPDAALAAAKAADAQIQAGNHGPLTGIPIAHKDTFMTKGIQTTAGSKMLEGFVAPYESTMTTQLKDAGMVMLGKCNMDEFAMGSSNENSYFGACKNPWNIEHVPGGSSGGSAAVVAARMTPASTGTDTGGSIRQPGAFCGVSAIKPSYGRISRFGMIAFASSLDQAGPMAQTAEDLAILLKAMSGFDPKDSTSIDAPVPNYLEDIQKPLQGLTVGIIDEFMTDDVDPAILQSILDTKETLASLGVNFKSVHLPNNAASVPAYYVIAPSECSSNLARFDGVRYGHRTNDTTQDLVDFYCRNRGEGFGLEVKRRIMMGTYALSAGYYDAYYKKAQRIRRLISHDFETAFSDVDAILAPVTPTLPFKIGEKNDDPIAMYLSDIFTIAANLAGLPGLSMPCGFANGLPIGAQLIGRYMDESTILRIAHQYQQVTDHHKKMPTLS